MSAAELRTAIAAAVNAVTADALDGARVNITPYRRSNLAPYQGFVHFLRRQVDASGLGWLETWQVWIALPVDVPTAEAWTDEHVPTLLAALDAELIVSAAFPAELQTAPGAPTVPGLVLEGIHTTT